MCLNVTPEAPPAPAQLPAAVQPTRIPTLGYWYEKFSNAMTPLVPEIHTAGWLLSAELPADIKGIAPTPIKSTLPFDFLQPAGGDAKHDASPGPQIQIPWPATEVAATPTVK
jgi:hypothetical protein